MTIYLYILQCSDDTYFTGTTIDLKKRITKHNSGYYRKCYTFKRRPVKLRYYCEFNDRETAEKRYRQIKNWSQAKKEALIAGNRAALPELSKKIF